MARAAVTLAIVFLTTSCAAPLAWMVRTGIRAPHAGIKFSLSWIPMIIVVWATMCMATYAAAFTFAHLLRRQRRQEGRSTLLSAVVGLSLGLSYACFEDRLPWAFAIVIGLGPVLFRACPIQGVDGRPEVGVNAT